MPETDAVVLRTVDYGEADRIVTVLTEDEGKLRGIARSARSSRRRFAPGLDPGNRGVLSYRLRPRSELAQLESLSGGRAFQAAGSDLTAYAIGQLALEVADALTVEAQPSPRTFRALVSVVDPPGGELASAETLLRFLAVALVEAGFAPTLDRCTRCETAPARDPRMDLERVGTACARCAPASAPRVAPDDARSLALGLAAAVEYVAERRLGSVPFLRNMLESGENSG